MECMECMEQRRLFLRLSQSPEQPERHPLGGEGQTRVTANLSLSIYIYIMPDLSIHVIGRIEHVFWNVGWV